MDEMLRLIDEVAEGKSKRHGVQGEYVVYSERGIVWVEDFKTGEKTAVTTTKEDTE